MRLSIVLTGILLMSVASEPEIVLRIDRTWDGREAEDGERVEMRLRETEDRLEILVEAPYHGDPPPPGPPGSLDGLWRFEVVELFVASWPTGPAATASYTEVELSPHGHHLVLRLEGARNVVERGLPIDYEATQADRRWSGTARVPRSHLPPPPWSVNAHAIHGTGAARRYLALYPVPGETPDFHRPERFRPLPSGL